MFSLGPVARASSYGEEFIPFDFRRLPSFEERLRAPAEWMDSVRTPLFVIEGTSGVGSKIEDLRVMRARNTNPNIHFIEVEDTSHFSLLASANDAIAQAILSDTGREAAIALAPNALKNPILRHGPSPGHSPASPSVPPFTKVPRGEDVSALYPEAAQRARIEGTVRVRCIVKESLRLGDCRILSETPAGWGFGPASIRIAQEHFEAARSTSDGQSTIGGVVTIPINWHIPSD